jgi:hypothetical protein
VTVAPPLALRRWFDRRFVDGLHASCEALYPPSHNGAPDAKGTDLGPRTEAYVRRLPPTIRVQVMLLFAAIEVFAPVLAPFGGWFSRRTPERRLRAVLRWRASNVYPLRLLGNAVHAQLQMLYLSHPTVTAFLGEHKPVAYPDDRFPVEIRPRPTPPTPERA